MAGTTMNTIKIDPVAQFGAIVRYETLLLWRARAWLAGAVLIFLLVFVLTLSMSETQIWKDAHTALANATPETKSALVAEATTSSLRSYVAIGTTLHILSLMLFPILFADVIAKDRQYGIRELWQSLPLGDGNYLAAKISAAMLVVLASMTLCSIFIWIAWATLVYPIAIPDFIGVIGLLVLPVAIPNTGIILLLTANQPSRRRAIMMAVGLTVTTLVLLAVGMAGSGDAITLFDYLNIGHPISVRFYISNFIGMLGQATNNTVTFQSVTDVQLLMGMVLAFAEVGPFWLIIRYFTKRQNA
jgi:hypothetical protein